MYQGIGELDSIAGAYADPAGSYSFIIYLLLFGVVGPVYFGINTRFCSDCFSLKLLKWASCFYVLFMNPEKDPEGTKLLSFWTCEFNGLLLTI